MARLRNNKTNYNDDYDQSSNVTSVDIMKNKRKYIDWKSKQNSMKPSPTKKADPNVNKSIDFLKE